MKLTQLHPNEGQIAGVPSNPRQIKEDDFRKLKQSLLSFRSMMEARPIVVDEDFNILGGNMRYQALCRLAEEHAKIGAYEFGEEIPDEWVKQMPSWSEEQKREFVIKDNNEFGDWDWDMLANEWDADKLRDWGCAIPGDWGKEEPESETARLSEIKVNPLYYKPKEQPTLRLDKCVDLTKYEAKMESLQGMGLTDEQMQVMELFARRFIRIDFESVANYYAYNATEAEKQAIERLRLVLVDGGGCAWND